MVEAAESPNTVRMNGTGGIGATKGNIGGAGGQGRECFPSCEYYFSWLVCYLSRRRENYLCNALLTTM